MKAVIIDDELSARDTLRYLIQTFCPPIRLVESAGDVAGGVALIRKIAPDIIFLDIQLHNESGFTLLQQFRNQQLNVVLVTAYDHYALKAIKFSAVDYLLKPVDIDELQVAVHKVAEKIRQDSSGSRIALLLSNLESLRNDRIAISTADGITFLNINQIIRCQADSNYTTIHLQSGEKHLVSKTLKDIEELLGPLQFMRIHNSHLINLSMIKKYLRGEEALLMDDGSIVEISSRKKVEVLNRLSFTNRRGV